MAILVVGGAIVWLIDRLFYHKNDDEKVDETEENRPSQGCADESCGIRPICPSEQILMGECKQEVVYYDDEELDAYRGRSGMDYNDAEIEEFRYVLETMREDEVAGWMRSLMLRGVMLPEEMKDEVLMIVGERRQ